APEVEVERRVGRAEQRAGHGGLAAGDDGRRQHRGGLVVVGVVQQLDPQPAVGGDRVAAGDKVGRTVEGEQPGQVVGGDVIHRGASGKGADEVIVRPLIDRDPVALVERDLVAVYYIEARRGQEEEPVTEVACDEVALAGQPAPDQVVGPLDLDA